MHLTSTRTTLRTFLRGCALISVTAAASTLIVKERLIPVTEHLEGAGVVRVERVEIVDEEGRVCIELAGGPHGGSMTLLQPEMVLREEGDSPDDRHVVEGGRPVIAYIGSPDGKEVRFELKYSGRHNSASFEMGVTGEPLRPFLNGDSSKNVPEWSLGQAGDGSTLRLYGWDSDAKQPKILFAK